MFSSGRWWSLGDAVASHTRFRGGNHVLQASLAEVARANRDMRRGAPRASPVAVCGGCAGAGDSPPLDALQGAVRRRGENRLGLPARVAGSVRPELRWQRLPVHAILDRPLLPLGLR